jgi:predicted dehydrogenase
MVRVGVVGLGKMGLLHAAIYNSLPESRLVVAAEHSRLLRDAVAAVAPWVRVYADADEMLRSSELDAVVITTPVGEHVPIAVKCVSGGIPFFMEKPLATSALQARDLVAALAEKPITHMVGYMTRYIDSFERGRALVASGCLGRIQRVSGTIYVSQRFDRGQGWRYDRKVSGGGVLLSQGSHLLDLLVWYFGPIVGVSAQILSNFSDDIEDFAHLMLEFRSGLRGWVDCSWSVRFHRTVETRIDVLGDNGSLVVTDDNVALFLEKEAYGMRAGWTVLNAAELYRGVEVDIGGPQYTREAKAFLGALRFGETAEPDVAQALHVQRIVDAAYASSLHNNSPQSIAL